MWHDVEKETPELNELVLVAFEVPLGAIQYTTAKYQVVNMAEHCDNYQAVWYVEVSGGIKLSTVTHWMSIDRAPNDNSETPF